MNERSLLGISMNYILICGQCHFNSFLFFLQFLVLFLVVPAASSASVAVEAAMVVVVASISCLCDADVWAISLPFVFFFLLLVISMIYWMCWHPLLIKIIIHLLNTLRAAYAWMHTYLVHSSIHPCVLSLSVLCVCVCVLFSVLLGYQHCTHNFDGSYVYILFVSLGKLESVCCC